MKKCTFCGTENLEDTLFCELCGHRFVEEAENTGEEPNIVDEPETESRAAEWNARANSTAPELESESVQLSVGEMNNNPLIVSNKDQVEAFSSHKQRSFRRFAFSILFAIVAIIVIVIIVSSTLNESDYNDIGADDVIGVENDIEIGIDDELPAVAPIDANEPNDSPDIATIAQVGNTYIGVLSSTEDKDYFRIEANGHSSLSYTFTRKSSRAVDGIGWEISHHSGNGTHSRMAWTNEKTLTDECDGIDLSDGYFIVWIENTRNDPDTEEVMKFVSHTEYSIIFSYVD